MSHESLQHGHHKCKQLDPLHPKATPSCVVEARFGNCRCVNTALTHAGPNKVNAAGGQLPQGAGVNQNPFASSNQASASNTPANAGASAAPSEATTGDDKTGVRLSPVGTLIIICFVCLVCNSTELIRCWALPPPGSTIVSLMMASVKALSLLQG